jgi:predicted ATPase/DNA-binding SARP family transcriptional activator
MASARQTTNLPAYLPPLVGRQAELTEVERLLARTRLLTLAGPGGVGKTRLALQVARDVCITYADGAWLVELGALVEPEMLEDVVAAALGVSEAPARAAGAQLLAFLESRETLLVLDNCEHLLPACAYFVETLVPACPRVRVLATSREVLGSTHEAVWRVPPLPLPAWQKGVSPEQAMAADAVQLFVQRAAATAPGFTLTADNAAVVVDICRRLDGLPLAIELAAGWVRMLALEQIAVQVATAGHALGSGRRTAPARHRTLAATMAWSYRLLTPEEQALFRRLSVLQGAFGLETVEAVYGEQCEVLHAQVLRLIDSSLVEVVRRDREARYRLLETVRQYGIERLRTEDDAGAVHERYCHWAEHLVEAAARIASDDAEAAALDRLELEVDHLRAVLGWLYEQRQTERALRLATSLVGFWRQRGHIGEGRRWLEMGLAAEAAPASLLTRARALNALGVLLMWQCAYEQAQAAHDEALAIFRQACERQGIAMTLFRLGFLADKRAEYQAATTYLQQSLDQFAALGDDAGVDIARNRLGVTALNAGKYERASAHLERSLDFQRAHGHTGGIAATLLNLGVLALEHGDPQRAEERLRESLDLNRRLQDSLAIAYALTYLGHVALVGNDLERAVQVFREALTTLDPESNPEILVRIFGGMATATARLGAVARAARLWGAMEHLRETHGVQGRPIEQRQLDREMAGVRRGADQRGYDAAWEEGQRMPLDAVFAYAGMGDASTSQGYWSSGHASKPEQAIIGDTPDLGLRIYGLGSLKVYRGEQLLTAADLTYSKAKELLFYLLRHAPRTKEQIGLALWPDATPDYLRMTFRVVLYHLRRALGEQTTWIVREQQFYTFNRSLAYWFDVEAFESAVSAAARCRATAPDEAQRLLETAVSLYKGHFWDGLAASEWVVEEQDALRLKYLDALLALAQLYRTAGDVRRALETFLTAVGHDRYCEEAHRGVIACYLELGEPSQAERQYERLHRLLNDELRTRPAPETLALLRARLEGAGGHD